jgi:hypothetical protein
MLFWFYYFLNITIGIGAVIGWSRFRKTERDYLPFIWLLTLGCINEFISLALALNRQPSHVNSSIYKLVESLLINYQFYRWGLYKKSKPHFYLFQGIFFILWLCEHIFFDNLTAFTPYFTIASALILVVLSTAQINQMVFIGNLPLRKHPVFLICSGFIIYFTFSVLVEMFMVLGISRTVEYRVNVFSILVYVGFLVNLLFIVASLCLPLKRDYILRS